MTHILPVLKWAKTGHGFKSGRDIYKAILYKVRETSQTSLAHTYRHIIVV